MNDGDATWVLKLLRDGGALGGLVLALLAVGYLFIKLHDLWKQRADEAVAEAKELQEQLSKEKDEHRKTAMTIVGLSQDLARLLQIFNERMSHGSRHGQPPPGNGSGGESTRG